MRPQESLSALVWRRFLKHKPAVAGLAALIAIFLLCFFVPWLTHYDPGKTNVDIIREPPSLAHIFGTDELGRDLFIRLWDGGRISILIGVATMIVAITIGTVIGSVAGFYGGRVDNLLMRFTDFVLSIPQLFLLLLFAQLLRSTNDPRLSAGPLPIIVIIGILAWTPAARLVRGQFLSLKNKEFVEAAKMSGARNRRIMLRHILPNAASPIIVAATLRVGAAIITESTLSFLGFGVQPPTPTWGNMLKNAQAQMTYAPWTAIFPGLAILVTVLALNYIGDGLRDALDPHHVE
ncbi:MAG: ABC transporter permease [Chloroflexi bacterium]|nr:ABC transporter permease [Chloroflexota bacterium]